MSRSLFIKKSVEHFLGLDTKIDSKMEKRYAKIYKELEKNMDPKAMRTLSKALEDGRKNEKTDSD